MEKISFKENLRTALTVGAVVGFFIGIFGGSIVSGLFVGLIVGLISCIMFTNDDNYYPMMGLWVGLFFGGTIGLLIGVFADVIYIGLFVGGTVGGYTTFLINDKNKKLLIEYENQNDKYANNIEIYADSHIPLKLGVENPVKITVNNKTETTISNIHLKSNFPKSVICNETIVLIEEVPEGLSKSITLLVTPTVANEINLDDLEITLDINGNPYEKEPVKIGIFDVIPPEIDIQIDVPNPFKVGMENPVKITVKNQSDVLLSNVQIETHFSRLITCDETIVHTDNIPSNSSEYTAIFITPRMADKINLGDLNLSYDINGNTYEKEPIAMGIYEAVEVTSHKPTKYSGDINSDISISRETEFYQGYIRFKMSVTNTSSFVVNDVALDFDYDHNLLRIDRREPDYQTKNGRTIFGNISANSSKTIAVYFDPMMCSKGADINCQVNYKDAKGQPQTTHMKPKQISVVCPIMETESDINIGRLKEFIEKLPYRDSKVYQVQNDFDIDVLKNISREIIQKHDVKHIRTLFTKDRNTCEIWYYGKTKVHSHDIVIKITILSETQNIELFAATETVESLAGLLAEVGRELKGAIENKVTGNVQQVINVSIKDSIIQRSNLLSYCDIDDNCSGDVVIEDSLVQRSDVGNVEFENKVVSKEMDKEKVYNYLLNIVNNSSNIEDMNIEYKEVLSYFNRDTQSMPLLFNRLNEICRNNHERKEPLISAIVVNEEPQIPGKGFFDNCMRKYRGYTGPSDGPKAQIAHNEELKRVFSHWHNGNKNSCPACGGVVPDGAKFCMECGGKIE
ncbi:MAG TPA: hypothetical protein C5S51_10410 [Methanosarcinaceae archaeon]|nr:hypothetical protein [Methanosarcinaceae archaeon]